MLDCWQRDALDGAAASDDATAAALGEVLNDALTGRVAEEQNQRKQQGGKQVERHAWRGQGQAQEECNRDGCIAQ